MNGAIAVVLLLVVIVASIVVVAIVRARTGRLEADYAVGFSTALYGLLLSLLLFTANGHYEAARRAASDEAAAATAVTTAAVGLSSTDRTRIQHDAICVMRATIDGEWSVMQGANPESGSPSYRQAFARLAADAAALQAGDPAARAHAAALMNRIVNLGIARDARVAQTYQQVAPVLWVILFIGAAVVVILAGLAVTEPNRRRWVIAMVPMVILLAAVFYVLAAVDRPYVGVVFHVESTAMRQAIANVAAAHPDADVLAACS